MYYSSRPYGFGGYGGLTVGGGFGMSGSSASASASSQSFGGGFGGSNVFVPMSAAAMPVHRFQEDRISLQSRPPAASFDEKPKPIEIRKTFPETWLFDSLEFDSE
jgi:hypothetical protein